MKNEDHVMPPEPEDKEGQIFTIKQKGCAMTSCVMLLNYHGVEVDPVELNVWLKENKGYSGRDIVWYKAGVFAQKKELMLNSEVRLEICSKISVLTGRRLLASKAVATGSSSQEETRI